MQQIKTSCKDCLLKDICIHARENKACNRFVSQRKREKKA